MNDQWDRASWTFHSLHFAEENRRVAPLAQRRAVRPRIDGSHTRIVVCSLTTSQHQPICSSLLQFALSIITHSFLVLLRSAISGEIALNLNAWLGLNCASISRSEDITVAIFGYPPVVWWSASSIVGTPSPETWIEPFIKGSDGIESDELISSFGPKRRIPIDRKSVV